MKSLVYSYLYPVPSSPFLKGLMRFLEDRGTHPVFIGDPLDAEVRARLPRFEYLALEPRWPARLKHWAEHIPSCRGRAWVKTKLDGIRTRIHTGRLRRALEGVDVVFAAEIHSLRHLKMAGFDLGGVVYLSLESVDCLVSYPLEQVKELIREAKICVIQSEERRKDFEDYLKFSPPHYIIPVAMYPIEPPARRREPDGKARLIYSGYLAHWACLKEALEALEPSDELLLQGHSTGVEEYRDLLVKRSAGMPNVRVDTARYGDEEHRNLLAQYDIGLAFYENLTGSPNWKDMLYASGKIATYLWSGMAVLTNVEHPLTLSPPFLYVPEINNAEVHRAIRRYEEEPQTYHAAALEFARKHYDLKAHLQGLWETLGLAGNVNSKQNSDLERP